MRHLQGNPFSEKQQHFRWCSTSNEFKTFCVRAVVLCIFSPDKTHFCWREAIAIVPESDSCFVLDPNAWKVQKEHNLLAQNTACKFGGSFRTLEVIWDFCFVLVKRVVLGHAHSKFTCLACGRAFACGSFCRKGSPLYTRKDNVAKLRSVVVVSVIASWLHTRIKSQRSFWSLAFFSCFFSFVTFLSFVSSHLFLFLFLGNVECMCLGVSLKTCEWYKLPLCGW